MAEDRTHDPKALIVCVSEHHGNTRKVAEAMAEVLDAEIVEPEAVDVHDLRDYDLVGFGSGIYFGQTGNRLNQLAHELPPGVGRAVFTFSTSGTILIPWMGATGLRRQLKNKGYRVFGDFNCRGFDTMGPLRFIGGLNQHRPNDDDLARARRFAGQLRARSTGVSTATT